MCFSKYAIFVWESRLRKVAFFQVWYERSERTNCFSLLTKLKLGSPSEFYRNQLADFNTEKREMTSLTQVFFFEFDQKLRIMLVLSAVLFLLEVRFVFDFADEDRSNGFTHGL